MLVGLVVGFLFPITGLAADGTLSIAISPSEIVLTTGASASVLVILRNVGTSSDTDVRVQAVSSDGSVSVAQSAPASDALTLTPNTFTSLTYVVARTKEGISQDVVVLFEVTYSSNGLPNQIAIAPLTVKAAAATPLLDARIASNVDNINENRPGEAALIVSDLTDTVLTVASLEVTAPASVEVKVTCRNGKELTTPGGTIRAFTSTDCPLSVNPKSQLVLHIGLATGDSIAPGPRTVVMKVTATDPDTKASASSVATLPFTIDVYAESDILKAVGVPVLLLLPGVIVAATAWFLISHWSPLRGFGGVTGANGGGTNPFATVPVATIVSLFLSLVVAWLYPWLTLNIWPHQARDYLRAYGFRDFNYIVTFSFAIGLAIWLLTVIGFPLGRLIARWLVIPMELDDERSLLRKIGLRGVFGGDSRFKRVQLGSGSTALHMGGRANGKSLLVAPIAIVFNKPEPKGLAVAIESRATRPGRLTALSLWWRVQDAVRNKSITMVYRDGEITAPQLVEDKSFQETGQLGAIVEIPPRR